MKQVAATSYSVSIYVAGDISDVVRTCRAHTLAVGLCVTVEPLDFVFTGGAEAGARVGLINYPRFPATPEAIWDRAVALAGDLIEALFQQSAAVVGPDRTLWISRRPGDIS